MRLFVSLLLLAGLIHKTLALVERVVKLAEGVGELPSVDKEFKTVGNVGVLFVALRERRDDRRVADDEGRLDEIFLDIFLKEERQDVKTREGGGDLHAAQRRLTARLFIRNVHEVNTDVLLHKLRHRRAAEWRVEVDLRSLIVDHAAAKFVGAGDDQLFGKVHHVHIVAVGPVDLHRGELGVVALVHALVAELLADLVNASEHADDETFEVKLGGDTHVHVDIKGVVVRDEGTRVRAARDRRKDRRLHLERSVRVEHAAEGLDYLRALAEGLAHLGVRDQVGVALAVTDLHVLKAVVLLRHRAQRLGEQREFPHGERKLAALGAEGHADKSDEVACVDPLFEEGVVLLSEHVELEAELEAVAFVLEGGEGRLAVAAQHDDASRRLYFIFRPLFGFKVLVVLLHISEGLLYLIMVLLEGVISLLAAQAHEFILALAEYFLLGHGILLLFGGVLEFLCQLDHFLYGIFKFIVKMPRCGIYISPFCAASLKSIFRQFRSSSSISGQLLVIAPALRSCEAPAKPLKRAPSILRAIVSARGPPSVL